MIDWSRRFAWTSLAAMTALMIASSSTAIAQECKNRGQLDTLYCDDNNDLVADVPTDPKKLRDPSTLVFAYTRRSIRTCSSRSPISWLSAPASG
jgi:hypothetical protein